LAKELVADRESSLNVAGGPDPIATGCER
jgi:hypothetical protein